MAAVVAATALKGRGARNARVLRGKERDPGEGSSAGDPLFSHPARRQQEVKAIDFLLTPLYSILKNLGAERWSLEVTQSIPLPLDYTPLGSCCEREPQGSL